MFLLTTLSPGYGFFSYVFQMLCMICLLMDYILICTIWAAILVSMLRQVGTTIYPFQDQTPKYSYSKFSTQVNAVAFPVCLHVSVELLNVVHVCYVPLALCLSLASVTTQHPRLWSICVVGFCFQCECRVLIYAHDFFSVDTHRVFRCSVYQIPAISPISRLKND